MRLDGRGDDTLGIHLWIFNLQVHVEVPDQETAFHVESLGAIYCTLGNDANPYRILSFLWIGN